MIENTMLSASSLEDACEKKSPPKVSFFLGGRPKKDRGRAPGLEGREFFFSESRFSRFQML